MSSSNNAQQRVSPSALLGRGMRRVRIREGKVLADVAAAAQELGIPWDAAAVSRIETGKRSLSLDEYLMLPRVLSLTLGRPVVLGELLVPVAEADEEADLLVSTTDHRERLFVNLIAPTAHAWMVAAGRSRVTAAALSEEVSADLDDDTRRTLLARSPVDGGTTLEGLRELAGNLGVTPYDVLGAAGELWGAVTLEQERERRLLASGEDLSNPTRLRTVRGHLTRTLTQELREHFAAHPVKKPRAKRKG